MKVFDELVARGLIAQVTNEFFPAFSCFAVLLFLFYRHIQFQEINVAVFS